MKNVLFLVGFCFISLLGIAQETYTLSGTVILNNTALPGANITVKNSSKATTTDFNGFYSLALEEGNYTLIFSYGNQKTVEVELTGDQTLDVDLTGTHESLEEVFLSSIRVDADSPITYSNLTNEEIEERNLGQDIPVLMNYLPSVVTTTDAGNGVGYTGIRVRGSDATRTNVTVNGIPINDAESQGTFWVNMGDFASSTENIQLQRGVGTSTNGAGAFGASINILTDRYSEEAYAEVANSYGSYNTHKHTVKFSTGLFNDHWEFAGRASQIKSDGYIDRAESDLKSYFLQGSYVNDGTLVKAIMFGGKERTYQAWYGVTQQEIDSLGRTYNPAGRYTDENGNVKFYNNQTDNYQQDHYQLLWNQKYNKNWSSNLAFHYTRGKGYYEEYEVDRVLTNFGLEPFMANGEEVTKSDLVNTSWLDNHFYGTTFSVNYQNNTVDAIVGGGWNRYDGDHFGEVIYTRFARNNDPYEPFYENNAVKTDFNLYTKATVSLTDQLAVYGDLQIRTINYEGNGPTQELPDFPIDANFSFFNPKGGFTFQFNEENQLYGSVAVAHREPSRSDYEDAFKNGENEPTEERLVDYELGWRFKSGKTQVNTNLYFMNYKDQLVLTGEIDEEGAAIRKNSGKSYRLGLEVDANIQVNDWLSLRPNIAVSQNKNKDFVGFDDDIQQNLGDTDIAYSPNIIAGNIIRISPARNLQLNWLSKYVGEQYMTNLELKASKLESYFVNDFNVQYVWDKAPLFKEVVFTGLVNNIFDVNYISNGNFYSSEYIIYYPQATINFLAGITLKF
ncbi:MULTISPECIES: TonB-dependent receptor [Mesonia]|uniref:Vitamin B12 transporter BtuB n=1 Tax=Mesonia oceanica TaxID=2687242 RepID=A0AC61Y9S3_9FLAO|nr:MULTISPECIES: TonB-dependent receptor [Mesonia]MAN27591.1 TonB-dependent receptor [Mesonia sp.]MAQ40196.1 TonB-dependent receptor [Mesonia sp.]MBJ97107.1 TonB-dependent receptor [Flavobacteriaceae bacterium]VVV00623.1 Vitamin B12 transporter BtuB [Mesonia oceanica]|tara:strand:+ start:5787 stop:8150 length:2364 start_codon:yes stop_codon:yes gene_type:complete